MKIALTLALTLAAGASAIAAPAPSTSADTQAAEPCRAGLEEVRVVRIFAGVVSYTTRDGRMGALPQAASGANKAGDFICLPSTAGNQAAKRATSTK